MSRDEPYEYSTVERPCAQTPETQEELLKSVLDLSVEEIYRLTVYLLFGTFPIPISRSSIEGKVLLTQIYGKISVI